MKKIVMFVVLAFLLIGTLYYFIPEANLPAGMIDKIVVHKSENRMEVFSKGKLLKRYTVSIGQTPIGDKQSEGDKRTPEGQYIIHDKNPNSGYYKNLGISYPDDNDIREAKRANVSPGGEVKIHGLRNGLGFIGKFHRIINWTAGCIALTNAEIDELYNATPIGTPIEIKP